MDNCKEIKVALYMRCSTDMQEMSIPDQRKIIKKYCEEKGYKVAAEFVDEGISGTTFEKRPGIMRLIQTVQSKLHAFSKLIILNESRFGRVPDTKEAIHYDYLIERCGVQIEYVQSNSNLPGAAGIILRTINLEQAAKFSLQLSKDVIRGHSTAAEKGYSTGGFPPIGYNRMVCDEAGNYLYTLKAGERKGIKNQWVKWIPGDPKDIALVNRIFRLYAEGNKGLKAICKVLNTEKIPSPKDRLWGADTLRSILINRAYIGERIYGGKWSKKVTEKIICPNAHEPIIPRELFEKAQSLMKSRGFGRCNGMRTQYLLSGKITCKDCGYKFQGRKVINNERRIYYYYVDSGFLNYKICKSLRIPKNTKGEVKGIEDFVISQIEKMIDSERYIERFKTYLKNILIELEKKTDSNYPFLKRKLKEIDEEIIKIQDTLIETKSRSLGERLLKREDEREELLKEIKKYEGIKNQPSKVLLLVNEYAGILRNFGEILRKRDHGEQKTAIGYFLDRIEVIRSEGVARCYFYDLPHPKEIDYILPGYSSDQPLRGTQTGKVKIQSLNRVCQDGAEGYTT